MGSSLNMIIFWQCIVHTDPSGSGISSCPLGTWSFYKHTTLLLWHNRNFYVDTDYMGSRIRLPRNQPETEKWIPTETKSKHNLATEFLILLQKYGNRTQYWTCFFVYVISDQLISKRCCSISMGKTELKVIKNSIWQAINIATIKQEVLCVCKHY